MKFIAKYKKENTYIFDKKEFNFFNNDFFILDNQFENLKPLPEINGVSKIIHRDTLYYYDYDRCCKSICLSDEKKDINLLGSFGFANEELINNKIIIFERINKIKHYYLYNLILKQREFEIDTSILKPTLTSKNIFYIKGNTIFCKNIFGSDLWNFSLSSIAPLPHDTDTPDTVSTIIGVASQKLWVRTEAGRLIVLDIETGELLKIFSHHESDKKQGYTYNEGFGSIYIKENDDDYLYCMGYDNFQKINAKTITIQEAYDTYKEDPVGIASFQDIYSPLLQGDYFTFIGRKHGESGGIRHIGIFDYTAKKLVWQYQVISEEEIAKGNELIAPEPLYISGNKLYVKDFHQTLHIFEKEEHIS